MKCEIVTLHIDTFMTKSYFKHEKNSVEMHYEILYSSIFTFITIWRKKGHIFINVTLSSKPNTLKIWYWFYDIVGHPQMERKIEIEHVIETLYSVYFESGQNTFWCKFEILH